MKIVVLGAGALGSILAGHLIKSGEDVTVLSRGARAEYLKQNGITVTGLADFNVPCSVVTDPSQISGADLLIVAVKTHQMETAISGISHAKFSSVLSVLNGVHANERLGEVFGAASSVGSTAYTSGEMESNGVVQFTVNSEFLIGELPEGLSDRAHELAETLQKSGINTKHVENIQTFLWSKFMAWAGFSSVALLTRQFTYRFLSDPDTALMCARIMREVAALADYRDIPMEDSGPFPVKTVAGGSEEEAVLALQKLGAVFEEKAPGHRMSALQDLDHGRRLEIDETLGYAVEEADRTGIPIPTLETCFRLLGGINRNL